MFRCQLQEGLWGLKPKKILGLKRWDTCVPGPQEKRKVAPGLGFGGGGGLGTISLANLVVMAVGSGKLKGLGRRPSLSSVGERPALIVYP